jgi:hypothetical protein
VVKMIKTYAKAKVEALYLSHDKVSGAYVPPSQPGYHAVARTSSVKVELLVARLASCVDLTAGAESGEGSVGANWANAKAMALNSEKNRSFVILQEMNEVATSVDTKK